MSIVAQKRICNAVAALGFVISLLALCGPTSTRLVAKAHAQADSGGRTGHGPSEVTESLITLRSITADFPGNEQMFPGGSSAQAINNNCLGCHSPDMVLTQPALSPSTWQQEVGKMRTVYKAPVLEEDVPAIIAYLSNLRTNE